MLKDFSTIEDSVSVFDAAKTMSESGKGFLIILKAGRPEGIVTERDFVDKILVLQKDPLQTKVGEIMSSPLITVDPDEDLLEASNIMNKHNIRRLPVVKNGIIYGVLTSRDVAKGCSIYVDKATREIAKWSFPFG